MPEDISNIRAVCESHAPSPKRDLAERGPESYINHFVKKAFIGTDPITHREKNEHMWVQVLRVVDGELEGELNNDPVFRMKIKCGDVVRVKLEEIEEFCE